MPSSRATKGKVPSAALGAALLAATAALAACDARPSEYRRWQRGEDPGLVVLLVIDQFPEWAFEQKLPQLTAGGFRRILSEGQWQVGEYPYSSTLTAPGHAMIGSGEPPRTSGILSNEWWRRDSARVLRSVEAENGDVSAKWLRVPALGDAVAAAGTGAKAVSIALKDRAAVLPLGHAGTAVWYSPRTVDWLSNAAPPWLAEHNRAHPMSQHLHHVWTPLYPERMSQLTGRRDAQPGEAGDGGLTSSFPHQLDLAKSPPNALLHTPLGNQLVLDTAQAAIAGERLGHDEVPDLLIISLSSFDYVAHAWGHESWEAWDTALRLDGQLADFFAALDRQVGDGRWSLLVTSDHGGSPLPELSGGGRMQFEQIDRLANEAAASVLGPGDWIADPKYPTIYLSEEASKQAPERRAAAIAAILAALRAAPPIARAERTADLAGHCESRSGDELLICESLDPERSGEIYYQVKRGWILESLRDPLATSHGTLYDYDRQVPILTMPFGSRDREGSSSSGKRPTHPMLTAPQGARLSMREVSRLVAHWLGVTPPTELPR